MGDAVDLSTIEEWIYPRPEGDIVVWASSQEEALQTICGHGFLVTEPKRLKRGGTKLTAMLKKEGIS